MAMALTAAQLVDEVWLQGSEEMVATTRKRIRRDLPNATEFRRFSVDLFLELWPVDAWIESTMYLVSIKSDIDKMPLDLIDDLVGALAQRAKACSADQPTASTAAQMLAGWLRARAVEMRSEGPILEFARQLKQEHANLFNELFLNQYGSACQNSTSLSNDNLSRINSFSAFGSTPKMP